MLDLPLTRIDGTQTSLSELGGSCWLIVNVASECGYTRQYAGLQALHELYNNTGLEICAFPCNQFGSQEPASDEEIQNFCINEFGVTFNIMKKCEVNGENRHSIYAELIGEGEDISWNFEKFLVTSDGNVKRFPPKTEPQDTKILQAIEDELGKISL